ASAINGTASLEPEPEKQEENMQSIYDMILEYVPAPVDNSSEPLQFQVALLDYNDYVGRIGIGRVFRGEIRVGQQVSLIKNDRKVKTFSATNMVGFIGLNRLEIGHEQAGDLLALSG